MTPSTSTLHAGTLERRSRAGRALLILAGVALAGWVVARAGIGEVEAELKRAGPKALLMLVPYALATAIGGLPWGLLLPFLARPRWIALVQSRFAASSANSVLPFFGLGGEPARLLWVSQPYRARGTAALVVDRVLYNVANGFTLLLGASAGHVWTSLPTSWSIGAASIGWLTIAGTVGLAWLVVRRGVGERAEALMLRLFKGASGQKGFGRRVDAALLDTLRGPKLRLLGGFGVHLIAKLVLITEVWVGLWSLGAAVDPARALVLAVVPIALSFFFSAVPGQLGVQEGAQLLVAGALQLSPALVLSLVLLQRFRQLVFVALLPPLLSIAKSPAARLVAVSAK